MSFEVAGFLSQNELLSLLVERMLLGLRDVGEGVLDGLEGSIDIVLVFLFVESVDKVQLFVPVDVVGDKEGLLLALLLLFRLDVRQLYGVDLVHVDEYLA